MADLFDRLFDPAVGEQNIAVHNLYAALGDYAAGETTRTQIINWWTLDTEAQADLNTLCDAIDAISGLTNKLARCAEFHIVCLFVEEGAKYTAKAAFKTRLGL